MILFFSGLFLGALLGAFALSLCVVSSRADERAEEEYKKAGTE